MRLGPVTDRMVEALSSPMERAVRRIFKDAPSMETEPCEAVISRDADGVTAVVTVPWVLEPGEAEAIIGGGVIHLTTWGGLPPHRLDVVAQPDGDRGPGRDVV